MISLRKITTENGGDVISLSVGDYQRHFVASNAASLALAYILTNNGGVAHPFAVYHDEQPVGFVMLGYGTLGYSDEPKISRGNYCIWRFMIDQRWQNHGYGREALEQVLAYVRTCPMGPAQYCWLSYEPDNSIAKRLYESFGFHENGETCDGENVAVLRL